MTQPKPSILQLQARVNAVTSAQASFLPAVREFAQEMETAFEQLKMDIEERDEGGLQVYSIVTSPWTFRSRRSIMCTLLDQVGHVDILARESDRASTAAELKEKLLEFFSGDGFVMTLARYKEMLREDSQGWIRLGGYRGELTADDAMVVVPADVQRLIADASRGKSSAGIIVDTVLQLIPKRRTGRHAYNERYQYLDLETGGFVVEIERTEPAGPDRVKVIGTVRPESSI